MSKVDEIAERLRNEPYHFLPFRSNCIGKSFRFKRECIEAGIEARVVICSGIVEIRKFDFHFGLPVIHGWGEADHRRIELARPLDEESPFGSFDIDLRPIIAIWI